MPDVPNLRTERLVLGVIREDDASAAQRLLSVPGIASHVLSFSHPLPEGAALEWIWRDAARVKEGRSLQWAITLPGDEIQSGVRLSRLTSNGRHPSR